MTGLGARVLNGHSEMSKEATVNTEKSSSEDNNSNRFENIVSIQQLIDLTDKPIRLTRDEISWSRVKSNSSNCVCCCCNNSITLVTTDDSYVLDHIPLDNIVAAQANSGLQYLALANDEKLAIIDLVEGRLGDGSPGLKARAKPSRLIPAARLTDSASSRTRFVDLGALDLCMSDVIFWRWIDELTLALVTQEALFTCRVDQIQLNHPATTAALGRPLKQLLALTRICDIDPNLGHLCQITDVQRDVSTNLYAISGLYSPQSIISSSPTDTCDQHHSSSSDNFPNLVIKKDHSQNHDTNNNAPVKQNLMPSHSNPLRHNFSSVPGRLSQMASLGVGVGSPQPTSLDSASNLITTKQHNSSRAMNSLRRKISSSSSKSKKISTTKCDSLPTVAGLTQIYCKLRDRTQLIRAHAVSFTTRWIQTTHRRDDNEQRHSTTLVVANRLGNKLKVYFIGMATSEDLITSGHNVARSIKLDPARGLAGRADFPTAIVCSTLTPDDDKTHVAMIITKFGRLFVCSVTHGSILFDVQVSYDIVSGAVLESKSRGIMLICRNGQVLLARINEDKLMQMSDETNSMMHVPSHLTVSLSREDPQYLKSPTCNVVPEPSDIGLEVIISTKL